MLHLSGLCWWQGAAGWPGARRSRLAGRGQLRAHPPAGNGCGMYTGCADARPQPALPACRFYAPAMRGGARLGHAQLVDGMLQDGLWDAFHNIHMGECAGEGALAGTVQGGYAGLAGARPLGTLHRVHVGKSTGVEELNAWCRQGGCTQAQRSRAPSRAEGPAPGHPLPFAR